MIEILHDFRYQHRVNHGSIGIFGRAGFISSTEWNGALLDESPFEI